MKRTINALLFGVIIMFVFELNGSNIFSQARSLMDFEGNWVFEKAEYLERGSLVQDYQVKYAINTAEGLEKLDDCLHQAVKRISISDITQIECPFTSYCGRAHLVTIHEPKGDRYRLTVGAEPEELGKETPIPGLFYNAPGIDYWIDWIDDETIAITKEAYCVENSVGTHRAVRCILKKTNKKQTS